MIVDLNDKWEPWFAWYPVKCLDNWTDVQHPEISVRSYQYRWCWLTTVYCHQLWEADGLHSEPAGYQRVTKTLWLKAHIIYGV